MIDSQVIVTKTRKEHKTFHSEFVIQPEFIDKNPIIRDYRIRSWNLYNSLPMPNDKDDDWKRTSLKEIKFDQFKMVDQIIPDQTGLPVHLSEPVTDQKHSGQLLMTPWDTKVYLDPEIESRGVIFEDIKHAAEQHPQILKLMLNKVLQSRTNKFSSLAGALEINGVLLYVPKNVNVSTPLQSVYWAPTAGNVHALHVLVYLEEGASVTYVHESSSPEGVPDTSIHTGIMELFVGEGAHLNFVELQSWGENVINFTRENVSIEKDGSVDWIFGATGSRLTKNYSDLNLIGRGSTGKMSGFYFADGKQHLDHDTQQNHLAPNTTSDLLFKGALLEQSRSVWQGMIYVAPNASKTDGYQANKNLVLSKGARADSIPGLEILTDDVKCSHGATMGNIDQEQVFYLQSRGVQRDIAERLIVEGFFDPIMQRIPFDGVKKRFQSAIKEKMEHIA